MPVDPFLPDEQIIASFTEEEKGFHAWYCENQDALSALTFKSDERGLPAAIGFTDAAWPDPEVQRRYWEWQWEWCDRMFQRMTRAIPQSEFLKKVSATNFGSASERGEYLWMMEMLKPPFCLIGEADFGGVFSGYGLDPGTVYLWPNFELETDPQLVSRNILAVNTDVKVEGNFVERHYDALAATTQASPKKRRRDDDSSGGESTRSTDSNDADLPGGFLFVQLGSLIAYTGDWAKARALEREEIIGGPWTATGFGLVLQIDSRGRPGSVWVIYNFHNEDEEGRRFHIPIMPEGSTDVYPHIGRLTEECDTTFTIAKIAENLGELQEGAKFNFQVQAIVEFQIVRVKECLGTPGDPLVRQFVRTS